MKRFWLTYLLMTVIGTAAVHYGALLLCAHPGFLPLGANYLPQPPASVSARSPALVCRAPEVTVRRPQTRKPGPTPNRAQELPPQEMPEAVAAEVPQAASASEPPVRRLYTPPPPNPEATSWCILLQQAPGYGADGTMRRTFPAGTVGEIIKRTPTANGDMAVCTVDVGGHWQGPVWIGLEYLVAFQGSLSEAPPPARDLLYRYYTLKGNIDARQAVLRQRAANANPHAAACTRAATDLKTFYARVKKLTAERDAATGPKRSTLINTLHGMQSQLTRLQLQLKQAEDQRKAWEAQHLRPPDGQRDPEIAGWLEELRQLEPEKQQYVP